MKNNGSKLLKTDSKARQFPKGTLQNIWVTVSKSVKSNFLANDLSPQRCSRLRKFRWAVFHTWSRPQIYLHKQGELQLQK